jgi:integrase
MRGTLRRRPGKKHEDAWELAVDLDPDPASGRRRRLYKVFKGTRKEAEHALSKLIQDADSAPLIDPSRETVGAFLERWLRDYVQANVAPKTRMYYSQVVRQHIVPRLGRKKLQQLRSVDIVEAERFWLEEGWLRTATQRGLSAKSVANIHRILHLALRHAVDWKLLAANPIEGVRPPRWERKEQAWLDLDQARSLVHHLENTSAGTAVLVKLSTGLRMGELLGLRWREIDFGARSIALQQQLQWIAGQGYVMRAVKSHRSRRPVSIDADLVDVLRAYKVRQNEIRLQAGELWQQSDLVFANEVGRYLTPDQVRRALLRALRDASLPRIRPHDLRHTHASVLLRLRTPMKVVQERLGHSSYAITADIYSHVAPDLQEQAAGVFGAALRTSESDPAASGKDA